MDMESLPCVADELDLMQEMLPLAGASLIELGCGNARVARALLQAYPSLQVTGLEVDAVQHRKNLENPQERLRFVEAGAQAIPLADAVADIALMLKSLHHVPLELMQPSLNEIARVLRPGAYLYVSEPIFGGDLNEIVRLYNDEAKVRAAAQQALDAAILPQGLWEQVCERRFSTPVRWRDFDEFEARMMRPSYADHRLDEAKVAAVRRAFNRRVEAKGPDFVRPMHVRLLQRKA